MEPAAARGPAWPWFRQRPAAAIVTATVLFTVVFVLRLVVGGSQDSISALYAHTVALLALTFGVRTGTGAGIGAIVLIEVWVRINDIDLTPLALVSRATPLLLLGVLVGAASDQIRAGEARDRELAAMVALQREAAEINDTIVQGLAASKWRFESGDIDHGLETLTDTMTTAQALVGKLLTAASRLPCDRRRREVLGTSG
jgi:hypothetical protein